MCPIHLDKSNPGIQDTLEFSQNDICSFFMKKLLYYHRATYLHSIRVASLTAELLDVFGIRKEERERMLRSALLHDIGKTRIDRSILDKQGPLAGGEWTHMKHHCRYGADMLELEAMKNRIDMDIILYHHENLDGTGYDGLTHHGLSLGVRIVCVTDRFDAMTQPLAYGRTNSWEDAFEELYRWRGILYDPSVVDALYTLKKMEGTADGYR